MINKDMKIIPKGQQGLVAQSSDTNQAIEGIKVVGGYLPFVGTALDAYELYKNPSFEQAAWTGVGLASDIFLAGTARAAIKAARQFRNSQNTLKLVRNPLTKKIFTENAVKALHRNNQAKTKVIRDATGNVGLNMAQNTLQKYQEGGVAQDNTRVQKPQVVLPFKLSREQLAKQLAEKNQARIYDKDKADYYRNLQRAYNSNFFGFGVFGNQTNYDSTTTQGQKAIEASANYTKDNIANFGNTLITTGVGTVQRGILPLVSRRRTIGQLRDLSKYKIGEGAEAIVINNSPTTVGKITTIPKGEMNLRNSIPNTIKSKFVGYVKDKGSRFPTYVQRKAKTITEEAFPKYIKKLDKAMKKKGYEVVESPDIQYRAYTNGNLVVDDVSPDNIALNWLRKPKMIDFTVSPADSWIY